MHRHRLFCLSVEADRAEVHKLEQAGSIFARHDQIDVQLENLARIRTPGRGRFADRSDVVTDLIGGVPLDQYGVWVYYPWSGNLVHILDEPEFIEVRTAANRNKLTTEEQALFSGKTVGVLGLSVGNAIALTMAAERTFTTIKVADYDELDLSNLNRLRANVGDLGINKAELAARQIAELDPYLTVIVYDDGIDDLSIDEFFDDAPALDLLIEECDMPFIKILARERAKVRGVPVLTEASDRGLLEIERFDLDPDYPLLGGLLGDLSTESLEEADRDVQLTAMAAMIGIDTISDRTAASVLELDNTLSTWPQLAAEVTHGGAVVASTARAIFLGHDVPSGRRHVDIPFGLALEPKRDSAPTIRHPDVPDDPDLATLPADIREILELAMRAPSGGNTQPWRFVVRGRDIDVVYAAETFSHDPLFNCNGTPASVTLGAVTESVVVAARARNLTATVEYDPEGEDSPVFTRVIIGDPTAGVPAGPLEQALGAALLTRCTQRTREKSRPLTAAEEEALEQAADFAASTLWLGSDEELRTSFGEGTAVANRLRVLIDEMNAETFSEFYFREDDPDRRDGVPLETLGMTMPERTMMRVLTRPAVAALLRERGEASALLDYSRDWIINASAVGAITVAGHSRRHFVDAGRAFLRVWLTASTLGIGIHPVTALLHESEMLDRPEGKLFTATERSALRDHLSSLRSLLLNESTDPLAVTFRIVAGPAMPEVEPAPRRSLSHHVEIIGAR